MKTFDAIVLGIGGMGSAALQALARRGLSVLGIEQFAIGHDRGSSHGEYRIIRRSYFEHPDYIPLVDASFEGWLALEKASGERLFERTGLLVVGKRDHAVIEGIERAHSRYRFALERLAPDAAMARFPGFRVAPDQIALFEPDAGMLRVEDCVITMCQQALDAGATLETGQTVRRWWREDGQCVVETDRSCFRAARLIIAAGPWTGAILSDLELPIRVERRMQMWFRTPESAYRAAEGAPVFCYALDHGFFYGFPAEPAGAMKIAEHSGNDPVGSADELDRARLPHDLPRVQGFIRDYLPLVRGDETVRHSACMYSMTPDEHFIVDRHPTTPGVAFAAGFSGHGFKFAPAIGELLAKLVLDPAAPHPYEFLRCDRAAILR